MSVNIDKFFFFKGFTKISQVHVFFLKTAWVSWGTAMPLIFFVSVSSSLKVHSAGPLIPSPLDCLKWWKNGKYEELLWLSLLQEQPLRNYLPFFVIKWLFFFFLMHLHPANLPKQIQQLNFPKRLTQDKSQQSPSRMKVTGLFSRALPYPSETKLILSWRGEEPNRS